MINAEKLADMVGNATVELQVADLLRALAKPQVFEGFLGFTMEITAPAVVPPKIGDYWNGQGGIYAGMMRGEAGKPDYALIVPTDPKAGISDIQWGGRGIDEPDATSEYDGFANTRALAASMTDHPAAEWAFELVIDGFTDFYLPARRELSLLYANVPELFEKVWTHSSTQFSASTAWIQYFDDGGQDGADKSYEARGVAVRRLAL
jgi:hypothetical protein